MYNVTLNEILKSIIVPKDCIQQQNFCRDRQGLVSTSREATEKEKQRKRENINRERMLTDIDAIV